MEYKINPPIDTVIGTDAMEMYLKLFRHLWQMKRMEKTLDKGWMRVTGGAQSFIKLPGKPSSIPPKFVRILMPYPQNYNTNGTRYA